MSPWYMPSGVPNNSDWHDAVLEVALLTGDTDAVDWLDQQRQFWQLMWDAGVMVGAPRPPPEELEARYARLDRFLGIEPKPAAEASPPERKNR